MKKGKQPSSGGHKAAHPGTVHPGILKNPKMPAKRLAA
jgi:hypothetical protein